ncbi:uncharacterized protein MAM_01041 [Metarhizium album ARSEF 1941]|uniref:Uncharacterized protein n=1 Tax=Metarhizium album (strain ARSEF 1941) TaxID=1081103 RepID=A0A0B2X8Z1_METAS|nr:uncharacterized protein MAM_01041 [Metarhizium album ARSEF 1941]KHO02040.1 hypothetical protein MAM_01041 [Metarhizium album ARSEF 1941]
MSSSRSYAGRTENSSLFTVCTTILTNTLMANIHIMSITEIKHLVELLCDRMYWYMQRDKQDKNLKKMQADLDRCRPGYSESSNYAEVLKLQIDQCVKEKRKTCDRLSGTDGKLLSHLTTFIDRQTGDALSTQAIGSEDVDARLKALQNSLDEKFRTYLKEASTKTNNDHRSQLRKETEGLHIGLEQEKQKSAKLQKHMEEMEQRLGSLDKRHLDLAEEAKNNKRAALHLDGKLTEFESKLNELSTKIDDLATNIVTSHALSKELSQFDTVVSASEDGNAAPLGDRWLNTSVGMKTRQRLQAVLDDVRFLKQSLKCESVDGAPQPIASLHKRLESCMDMVKLNSKEQLSISEAVQAIEATLKLTSFTTSNDTGQNSTLIEQMIDQKVQPLFTSLKENLNHTMQGKLNQVAVDLGTFIDKERIAREGATTKADQSSADVSALRRDINVLKKSVSTSAEKLCQKISEQGKQVASCNERVASLESGLQRVSAEAETNIRKLELQLQTVNTRRSNVSTKGPNQDMTKHITNTTISPSSLQNISSLTSRLEAVEQQLNSHHVEGPPRKRKTAHK